MIIMGIDPGTAIMGYGFIEVDGGRLRGRECGCVHTSRDANTGQRLAAMYDALTGLIRTYCPDVVAIEELFFNKNSRTALSVGQARGVVILAAAHNGIEVAEYTPLEVKQSVAGFGRASKEQVQRMVQVLLNMEELPKPDDVADALAVAICHASFVPRRVKEQEAGGS